MEGYPPLYDHPIYVPEWGPGPRRGGYIRGGGGSHEQDLNPWMRRGRWRGGGNPPCGRCFVPTHAFPAAPPGAVALAEECAKSGHIDRALGHYQRARPP